MIYLFSAHTTIWCCETTLMDESREKCNRILFDILNIQLYSSDLQYLIESLENIKNRDTVFIDCIRINAILRQAFNIYKNAKDTSPVKSLEITFDRFVVLYKHYYYKQNSDLTLAGVENFDWISAFNSPQK
jgi:hypothetical protein